MGFTGGDGTPEHPDYFRSYGNLTQNVIEIKEAELRQKELEDFLAKAELATASTSDEVIVVTSEEIDSFLCENSFFYFYTNPYDDSVMAPNKKQNDQYLDG